MTEQSLPEPDAASATETARLCAVSRSTIYLAMSPDPAKRRGLPFLKSFKVMGARRISAKVRRAWLAELEAATSTDAEAA